MQLMEQKLKLLGGGRGLNMDTVLLQVTIISRAVVEGKWGSLMISAALEECWEGVVRGCSS